MQLWWLHLEKTSFVSLQNTPTYLL
jgi:hypothetical protein